MLLKHYKSKIFSFLDNLRFNIPLSIILMDFHMHDISVINKNSCCTWYCVIGIESTNMGCPRYLIKEKTLESVELVIPLKQHTNPVMPRIRYTELTV